MRDEHGVLAAEQSGMNARLALEYVEASGEDLALLERLGQGRLVYDWTRDVFTSMAVGFIMARRSALIRWRVCGVRFVWRETKSDSRSRSSRSRYSAPSSCSTSAGGRYTS